jgi:hypothetical protein
VSSPVADEFVSRLLVLCRRVVARQPRHAKAADLRYRACEQAWPLALVARFVPFASVVQPGTVERRVAASECVDDIQVLAVAGDEIGSIRQVVVGEIAGLERDARAGRTVGREQRAPRLSGSSAWASPRTNIRPTFPVA